MAVDRARLTLPGLVLFLLGFAYLGAIFPVYMDILNANVSDLGTGEAFVYQLFLPLLLLVILTVEFARVEGG